MTFLDFLIHCLLAVAIAAGSFTVLLLIMQAINLLKGA